MSFGEKYPCMFQLIKQSKNVLSSSWFSPSLCFSSVSLLVPALHLCDFSPAATCTLLHWSTNQPPAGYIPALHSIISHIVQLANVFQIQRTASSSVFFLCYQACQPCPSSTSTHKLKGQLRSPSCSILSSFLAPHLMLILAMVLYNKFSSTAHSAGVLLLVLIRLLYILNC